MKAAIVLLAGVLAGCGFRSGDYVVDGQERPEDWESAARIAGVPVSDKSKYCPPIAAKMTCVENGLCVGSGKSIRVNVSQVDILGSQFEGAATVVEDDRPVTCFYRVKLFKP